MATINFNLFAQLDTLKVLFNSTAAATFLSKSAKYKALILGKNFHE
jgi:hypothetical protein